LVCRILFFNIPNNTFSIGEIPSKIKNFPKKLTVKQDKELLYWKTTVNNINFVNELIGEEFNNSVIFDIACSLIVFPEKYLKSFNDTVFKNEIFQEKKCKFVLVKCSRFYKFVCEKDFSNKDLDKFEKLINFNFTNGNFGFKLLDLIRKDRKSFSFIISNNTENIILGSPFFEKFPVMFDYDNKTITIYEISSNTNYIKYVFIFVIFNFSILVIIYLIIWRFKYICLKKETQNRKEELISEENER
jgi:hypothetical protein